MLKKESSQGPSSISHEIVVISYMDTKTLVFSDMLPEIAAVSSMNTETAESYIMLQKVPWNILKTSLKHPWITFKNFLKHPLNFF